jgi:ubiquitin-activating enzyme E1
VLLEVGQKHGLSDGDIVEFSEIKGMTELNGKKIKVETKGSGTFYIGDTRSFSPY